LSSIINGEINIKNEKNTIGSYCFLPPVDHTSAMIPEIISPAIAVSGDRGMGEDEEATGCVRLGEGVGGTDKLSDGVEIGRGIVVVGADSLDSTTVILVLRTFFIEGLLTLTK
jgi:hypothetical protein